MDYIFKNILNISTYHKISYLTKLHFQVAHHILKKYDLYPGQPPLLFYLHEHEGQNQKHLAKILSIKPATVNIMINRLEKSNFIIKKKDAIDMRNTKIYLTSKGIETCKALKIELKETEKQYTSCFSKDEIILFNNLLSKLINSLEEFKIEENL